MIILKIFFKINCLFKLAFFKLIYGKKLICGKKFSFRKGFSLIIDGRNAKVDIGNHVFFNNFCTVAAMKHITIGDNTIFGENVKIYDHNHQFKDPFVAIKNQGYTSEKITIGENCWIGSNVVILKGVNIGNHSIVGAGNVVYKDVPENSILLSIQQQAVKSSV